MSKSNPFTSSSAVAPDPRTDAATMRTLCRLVAGVAHEYNNFFNVIGSNTAELLIDSRTSPDARQGLGRIATATERATDLTKKLLLFSGQQTPQSVPLNLNDWLREHRARWDEKAGQQGRVSLKLCESPTGVQVDPDMLEQVVLALVENARDAMPTGGVIELSTKIIPATETPAGSCDEVVLNVADQGPGIAPRVAQRVFEPFFTTRSERGRLGLGLAVVQGVMETMAGRAELMPNPGEGARVCCAWPRVELIGSTTRPPVSSFDAQDSETTIMLIEDDDLLRETTVAVLKHHGYRVLQAEDGDMARETWHWHSERVALLLTDIVLPHGESGLQIGETFRTDRPDLPMILTSGFSHEIQKRVSELPEGVLYLPKPCPPAEMLRAVKELLSSATAGAEPERKADR